MLYVLPQLDGNTFIYTRHLNLYLVAVTRGNVNPAMVFEFLFQKIRIFKAYFKRDFDEDTLRNNMTLILELMDGEMITQTCLTNEESIRWFQRCPYCLSASGCDSRLNARRPKLSGSVAGYRNI